MELDPRKGIAHETPPDHRQNTGQPGMTNRLKLAFLVRSMII